LDAALKRVPECGWTLQALQEGAESLGYPPSTHALGAPNGPIDLVHHFVQKSTLDLKSRILASIPDFETMGTTSKIRACCWTRLEMLLPYVRHWPQALALLALPQNAPTSIRNLAELMDEMWFLAGDQSVDLNWYTKRFLLTGIFFSLNDEFFSGSFIFS
jgi:ubiquinone biosynthesis protein COQ9